MSLTILRPFDQGTDVEPARSLDLSFSTCRIFRAAKAAETLSLMTVALEADLEKRFPLFLDQSDWSDAWILAEDNALRGLIATAVSIWNKRLIIREFFVDRPHRRRGFGRLLLDRAINRGIEMGMATAFVETSNLNHPGVIAYERLGFELCGFDLSLYSGAPCPEEFALFLSRDIGSAGAPQEAKL